MKKYQSFVLWTAALLLAVLINPLPAAYADNASVAIRIQCPETIELTNSDIFVITCETEDGAADELKITAPDYTNLSVYYIASGNYTVTNIEYIGKNEAIVKAGYGVKNFFSSDNDGGSILTIAIGDEYITPLTADNYEAVVKDENHDENGEWDYVKLAEQEAESSAGNSSSGTLDEATTDPADTELNSGTGDSSAAEPVIEYYNSSEYKADAKEHAHNILFHLAICGIGGLVGLIVLYILHKKKII